MRKGLLGAVVLAAATMAVSPLAWGQVWGTNTAKQNMLSGAPVVAKRIDSADTAQYCSVASTPGTHFTWVDTGSSPLDYAQTWDLWGASCPTAVATMRGAEVFYIEQVDPISGAIPVQPEQRQLVAQEIQKATDGGAVVVLVPVDTAAQAAQVVKRAYYPPIGQRGYGPGQYSTIYSGVTSDYRATYNANAVVIAIVSTVEGAFNASAIAAVQGINALFMDQMNLESSSGYLKGSPQYEFLAQQIRAAATSSQKYLCEADRSASPHTLTCVRPQPT